MRRAIWFVFVCFTVFTPFFGCDDEPAPKECNRNSDCPSSFECIEHECRESGEPEPEDDTDDVTPPCSSNADCSDSNVCNGGETCQNGACVEGTPLTCGDNNICTDNSCDLVGGCVTLNNNRPCDDGSICTTEDICHDGVCVGLSSLNCDDDNECTVDRCNAVAGCTHEAVVDETSCSDGDLCNGVEVCEDGECQAGQTLNCDDDNECTNDSCDPERGCRFVNNSNPCSDGSACTDGDVCRGGECVSGAAITCNDGNVCTDDRCNPVSGCVFENDDTNVCSDTNVCTTVDTCVSGSCRGSATLNCDDDKICTADQCNPARGCEYVNVQNGIPCNDGNACTQADSCGNGVCQSGPVLSCNDGNVCTNDACDQAIGCTHINNTAVCNDVNVCTSGDVCAGGVCGGTLVQPTPTGCCASNADCTGGDQAQACFNSQCQNDTDGDGRANSNDNCPFRANAVQQDSDGDGAGNTCDNCVDPTDIDGDGAGNTCDNCPNLANADQADGDGDGVGRACDNCPEWPNANQSDTDTDGRGDLCEIVAASYAPATRTLMLTGDVTDPVIDCEGDCTVLTGYRIKYHSGVDGTSTTLALDGGPYSFVVPVNAEENGKVRLTPQVTGPGGLFWGRIVNYDDSDPRILIIVDPVFPNRRQFELTP